MASGLYYAGFYPALSTKIIDYLGGDVRLSLLGSTYSPDLTNHTFWSQVATYEMTGTGYSANGQSLTSKALVTDTTNKAVRWKAANVIWAAATLTNVRYGVLWFNTGAPTTSPLIKLIDPGQLLSSGGGGNFNIIFDTNGIIAMQ